jgi:hypothetical protein
MADSRVEIIVIAAGLVAWAAIFWASAGGLLPVSWIVSDGLLALLAAGIGYCFWRVYRRRGHNGA